MKFMKDTARVKIQHLQKKNVVELWDSSNDVARNNSVRAWNIHWILEEIQIILMGSWLSVPNRHDLIRNSRVNNAVQAHNRRLWKRMKRLKNVATLNLGRERDFYTKHAWHLNTTERMSMKIASTIQSTGETNGNYQCEMEKWQSEC